MNLIYSAFVDVPIVILSKNTYWNSTFCPTVTAGFDICYRHPVYVVHFVQMRLTAWSLCLSQFTWLNVNHPTSKMEHVVIFLPRLPFLPCLVGRSVGNSRNASFLWISLLSAEKEEPLSEMRDNVNVECFHCSLSSAQYWVSAVLLSVICKGML